MFYKNSFFIVSYVVILQTFSRVLLVSRVDLLSRLTPKKSMIYIVYVKVLHVIVLLL